MAQKISIGFLIGVLIFVVALLMIVKQVYVGGEFVPEAFESQPIFELMLVGGAVWLGFILIGKFTKTAVTKKEIGSILLLTIALWYIWTRVLGSPDITILTNALIGL